MPIKTTTTKPKIRGGTSSIAALKKELKKGGGNDQYIIKIKDGEVRTVRFLEEPDKWFKYDEHFDPTANTYVPCIEGCHLCEDKIRSSKRWLVSALDIEENKVLPLQLPRSMVQQLLKKYERYSTITDRDYELARTGSGRDDTEYDVEPLDKRRMNLSRYDLLDLEAVLQSALPGKTEDEDDDEEGDDELEPPVSKRRQTRKVSNTNTSKVRRTRLRK